MLINSSLCWCVLGSYLTKSKNQPISGWIIGPMITNDGVGGVVVGLGMAAGVR